MGTLTAPHIELAASRVHSQTFAAWSAHRAAIAGGPGATAGPCPTGEESGEPVTRLASGQAAAAWFRGIVDPTAFLWALVDRQGERMALSASAFPALRMAESDARWHQEFADRIHIEFARTDEGVAWHGHGDGIPVLLSARWHPTRAQAIHAAGRAIGLLPVATVADYAVRIA